MPVTAPADKRFRRAQLKPARKRGGFRARWRLLVAAAVCAFVAYAAPQAASTIAALDIFQVRNISVRGNQRLSKGEVVALLDGLQGRSIFSVDLQEWRGAVMNSPWVADAALHRTLPATVEVTIQERVPLGIGRINGLLYLVDDRGAVIDEYGPSYADLDLPVIDGLSSAPGDELADAYRAMLARRLLDALRARRMAEQISQIDVSDSRNAVVLLEGDPTLLRLGSEHFVERLQSYLEIAPALRERVPAMDYVDLRFDARVYVKPSKNSAPVQQKRAPEQDGKGTQTG